MACYLAARGRTFDVDAFLATSRLEAYGSWRRGEVLGGQLSERTRRRHQYSGFKVVVSTRGRDAFNRQLRDAEAFLRECAAELQRLRKYPGVDEVWLDFGVAQDEANIVHVDMIPVHFITLAAAVPIAVVLSHYPSGGRSRLRRPGRKRVSRKTTERAQPDSVAPRKRPSHS